MENHGEIGVTVCGPLRLMVALVIRVGVEYGSSVSLGFSIESLVFLAALGCANSSLGCTRWPSRTTCFLFIESNY